MLKPQLFIGKIPPSQDLFSPIQNDAFFYKPASGGLWTSTYIDFQYGSDWVQWGYQNDFLPTDTPLPSWLLHPKKEAKVYTIDQYEDLVVFMEEFGIKNEVLAPFGNGVDYETFSKQYDVLHLTTAGQRDTHDLFSIRNGEFERREYTLNGFDCECSLFTNWCFDQVIDLGKYTYKLATE